MTVYNIFILPMDQMAVCAKVITCCDKATHIIADHPSGTIHCSLFAGSRDHVIPEIHFAWLQAIRLIGCNLAVVVLVISKLGS